MIDLKSIQIEVDTGYLYKLLADNEPDEILSKVFREMSDIEYGHARIFMQKNKLDLSEMPLPSLRAKLLQWVGKTMGYDAILGILLNTEKQLADSVLKARTQNHSPVSVSDNAHVVILHNILQKHKASGIHLARFEKGHRSIGGNALRAAVLGGNDGLVSNFSLIMGVAGASGSGQKEVLLAGLAGLLAGALSMALGEWISVKSSQELYENQMQLEADELENNPEGEERELALIYLAKGLPEAQAREMAKNLMTNKEDAHKLLVQEELGIHAEDLQGSAMEAAVASFLLFAFGAIIPLIPFFFMGGSQAVIVSTFLSAIGLFLIGAVITLFTRKSIWYSGFRQVLFGLAAATITYGIGKAIGISIAG